MVRTGGTSRWALYYYFRIRPLVHQALRRVEAQAARIPDPAVRALARESLETKRFHCEGGAVLVGAAPQLVRAVVAYQSLCDYLDTITDRGPEVSSEVIRSLHRSRGDALVPDAALQDYWEGHPQDDGGYMAWLVNDCQAVLASLPHYGAVADRAAWLADRYVDLQSLKHAPGTPADRAGALEHWAAAHREPEWDVAWWEFAAATGSTLGIFALWHEATHPVSVERARRLESVYFPWMGALHILLDYFVDQDEDLAHGDFNFVTCYPTEADAVVGIGRLEREAAERAQGLADQAFHRYVAEGLLGFYLSDRKVRGALRAPAGRLLSAGGNVSRALYCLAKVGRAP